jgi:hypothetical protein
MGQDVGPLDIGRAFESVFTLLLEDRKGCIIQDPYSEQTMEVHTCLLPEHRGHEAEEVVKEALRFAFAETGCMELLTKVPLPNKAADLFTRQTGFIRISDSSDGKAYQFSIERWPYLDHSLDELCPPQLAKDVRERYYQLPREMRPSAPKIGVSASTFVPKPHTAFQWEPQDSLESVLEKQQYLRSIMRIKGVDFSWHEPYTSALEAAFSRGDRRLCKVLLRAHELGCKFDGWSEFFSYDKWVAAFADCGLTIEDYAQRRLDPQDPLPWDHISFGVSKSFLTNERERALAGQTTPDCRKGCLGCGIQTLCKGECPTCAR